MATNTAQVGRPVVTTALLQIGLLAQMLGEADRSVGYAIGLDPVSLLPEPFAGQAFLMMSAILSVLAIVNFILLMRWLFTATRFIIGKTAPPMTLSPGWAIGCWFIPIVNFIAPCLVMSELYNATRAPANWKDRGPSVLALLWWGATLGGVVVGVVIRLGTSLPFALPPADTLYAGLFGCGTLRLLTLLILVTLITRFQEKASEAARHAVESVF